MSNTKCDMLLFTHTWSSTDIYTFHYWLPFPVTFKSLHVLITIDKHVTWWYSKMSKINIQWWSVWVLSDYKIAMYQRRVNYVDINYEYQFHSKLKVGKGLVTPVSVQTVNIQQVSREVYILIYLFNYQSKILLLLLLLLLSLSLSSPSSSSSSSSSLLLLLLSRASSS